MKQTLVSILRRRKKNDNHSHNNYLYLSATWIYNTYLSAIDTARTATHNGSNVIIGVGFLFTNRYIVYALCYKNLSLHLLGR